MVLPIKVFTTPLLDYYYYFLSNVINEALTSQHMASLFTFNRAKLPEKFPPGGISK